MEKTTKMVQAGNIKQAVQILSDECGASDVFLQMALIKAYQNIVDEINAQPEPISPQQFKQNVKDINRVERYIAILRGEAVEIPTWA